MTSNISLSPHFALSEFTKSATARSHGIKNEPAPEQVDNLKALCLGCLEPLREALGLPVVITSGYRTKALNSMLAHSSERSQHMLGQAAGGRFLCDPWPVWSESSRTAYQGFPPHHPG